MSDYKTEFEKWNEYADLDKDVRIALDGMKNNEDEIKMWFSSDISFGKAGLRGVMTAGTNAMNVYTVGRATQGIANLINSLGNVDVLWIYKDGTMKYTDGVCFVE